MKIVFFGTPHYVIPILDALNKTFTTRENPQPISAVVTQPPRPTGRKKELGYSEVDHWAHKRNIKKFYDSSLIISRKIEADLGVLASYGEIIPSNILKYFPHGIINVHPSLLPMFRGPSPVQATVVTKSEVGVSIIKLDEKMDHGPIISQFKDELLETDTTESLRNRLFLRSAEVLTTLIPAYMAGKTRLKPQNHSDAVFTTLIKKEHGFIDWKYIKGAMEGKHFEDSLSIPFLKSKDSIHHTPSTTHHPPHIVHYSPSTIECYFRALYPWPGLWTIIPENEDSVQPHARSKRMKILSLTLDNDTLILQKVQLEGKEETDWKNISLNI